jgi:hypothetical protein
MMLARRISAHIAEHGEGLVGDYGAIAPMQRRTLISNETAAVSFADCALCGDLDRGKRVLMRTELLDIPPCEVVCDQCLQAWADNVGFGCSIEGPTQH